MERPDRHGSANPTGVGFAGEWRDATGLINLRDRRRIDPRPEAERSGESMKQKGARMMPNSTEPVGFETDIKPMFRERDRNSMEFAFDLWSRDDVTENADAILARIKAGTMPCDGAWPQGQVDLFARWVAGGKPR